MSLDDEVDPNQKNVIEEISDYINGDSLLSLSQCAINYLLADPHGYTVDYVMMGLNPHAVFYRADSLFTMISREWSVEQFLELIATANLDINRDDYQRLLERYTLQVNSNRISINDEIVGHMIHLYHRLPYRSSECTRLIEELSAQLAS